MWPDNETDLDFLNFSGVAATVGEIVAQAQGRPISIGVSGAWGVGKSSMIKLIRNALVEREKGKEATFVFVQFNAWLYQGYDDARAALMEVIGTKLKAEAESRKTGIEKTTELLKRVDWLRAAKLTGSALAFAAGFSPLALVGEVLEFGKQLGAGKMNKEAVEKAEIAVEKIGTATKGILKTKVASSPPKEIDALRKCFEEALEEMGITLVVLIDDLDRCLPDTTISTLEAIRLFLFLKNTAFVVAADNEMIKYAVRRHFEGVNDEQLVTSYFDKLIQVPIRVPHLGTQEVRAYMMLLFVENSGLKPDAIERIRVRVCQQLGQTWQGKRVDRAFLQSLGEKLPDDLIGKLDTADRLAPIMATASRISGNPRLIKRFLNELGIRMAISQAHGVGVDEAVLVKMLLFERCGNPLAYAELTKAVTTDEQGKPRFLVEEWEQKAQAGEKLDLKAPWDDSFIMEWLTLPPRLADKDLRGVLYVSREHAPLITPEDRLSSDGAELLSALLEHPDMAGNLKVRLAALPRPELSIIMDRLLDRARQEQEWGVPPILEACLVISDADPSQGPRLAAFLKGRPHSQIRASIVPKIIDREWASGVLDSWTAGTVGPPVKKAITEQKKKNGNIAV